MSELNKAKPLFDANMSAPAKELTNLIGAGSSSGLLIVALFAWNTVTNLERKLDAHMADTARLMREQAEIIREIRSDVERLKQAGKFYQADR